MRTNFKLLVAIAAIEAQPVKDFVTRFAQFRRVDALAAPQADVAAAGRRRAHLGQALFHGILAFPRCHDWGVFVPRRRRHFGVTRFARGFGGVLQEAGLQDLAAGSTLKAVLVPLPAEGQLLFGVVNWLATLGAD